MRQCMYAGAFAVLSAAAGLLVCWWAVFVALPVVHLAVHGDVHQRDVVAGVTAASVSCRILWWD